jgi:hypothetical protein
MRKGTENRLGALLQGLLATFTGGSLILFAVLAATIGLSTPQSEPPSIAGGGSRPGGSVTVEGLGQDNQNAPGSGSAATGPTTAQGPAAPGATTGTPSTSTLVADSSDTTPSDSSAQASGEFGLSLPEVLTPDDDGSASDDGIGPPIGSPGVFIPTTDDKLPDAFKKRFGAGNALGARDVDKADRVDRRAARKAARKAAKPPAKAKKTGNAEKTANAKKNDSGKPSATGSGKKKAGKKVDKTGRADRSGSSNTKKDKTAGQARGRESKQADKQAKKESKEAKKESKEAKKEKGRSAGDDDDDDDGDDD